MERGNDFHRSGWKGISTERRIPKPGIYMKKAQVGALHPGDPMAVSYAVIGRHGGNGVNACGERGNLN
jgi:hypothetical protein